MDKPTLPVSRRLNWISATDPANSSVLESLQRRMADFYASAGNYYSDIDFTATAWQTDETYLDIVRRIESCGAIVEVGCGSANILKHHGRLAPRYSGCDFSSELMAANRIRQPEAHFHPITDPRRLPFADACADAVFSVYVIEHTVYPHVFLDECCRILKPGGLFILRCPDFLGVGRLTSQRAGLSDGNGRDKLRRGQFLDALLTGWDRKVTIPRRCAALRQQIGADYGFWLNLTPTCFTDAFVPDVDAVYLTYDREMISYLRGRVEFDDPTVGLSARHPLYLIGRKVAAGRTRPADAAPQP